LALAQFSQEALTTASTQSLFEHAAATIDATLQGTTAFLLSRTADTEWQVLSRGQKAAQVQVDLPDVAETLTFTTDATQSLALAQDGLLPRGPLLLVPIPSRHAERRWLGIIRHDAHSVEGDEAFLRAMAGLFGSAFDRAHAEERALNAQKLEVIGRLSGGVAHDFNNVLTAIMSASYELRELHPSADNEQAILDDLDGAVRRASLLTRQLLTFGRRAVTAPALVDLKQLVSELAPMLRRLVGSQYSLKVELPKEPVSVLGSLSQLEQVLLNLVVNARDAMPDGGPIEVRLVVSGGLARLSVSDVGCGMDEHTLRYAFQPFFTTKRDGTGLGLATVADVAEKLNGKVEVDSRRDEGTQVRFCVPIVSPNSALIGASQSQDA
jgi:signal transduction histidine kinase